MLILQRTKVDLHFVRDCKIHNLVITLCKLKQTQSGVYKQLYNDMCLVTLITV